MSTNLKNAAILLSKHLGDNWQGTTTAGGTVTTLIDTALLAKESDWIGDYAYCIIRSGTCDTQERKATALSSSTLTTLAYTAAIAASVQYEIHRLFSASDKNEALVHAAKASFPWLHAKVYNQTKTAGNWLIDGDFENWASSTALTYWTATTVAAAQESTIKQRGSYSLKITGTAGYVGQSDTNNPDLLKLAGQEVTFKAKARASVASSLRLAILSSTTLTYSDYHPGTSVWSDEDGENNLNDYLEVTATIADNPSAVAFRVYEDVAASTCYVDDARVIGPSYDKVYVGDLSLAQNYPVQVYETRNDDVFKEPWIRLRDFSLDSDNYLHLPTATKDYQLRIIGTGYLDFLAASVASTAWTATIAVDEPQSWILAAEAAVYLCNQRVLPNFDSNTTTRWEKALAWWMNERQERRNKFGMPTPNALVKRNEA